MTDLIFQTRVNNPSKYLSTGKGFSPDTQAGIHCAPPNLSNRSPPP